MSESKDITLMCSEELGLLVAQQYQMVMQANGNIQAIVAELDKRKTTKEPEKTVDGNT